MDIAWAGAMVAEGEAVEGRPTGGDVKSIFRKSVVMGANAEMSEKATVESSNTGSRGSRSSSLESLLQQACLQLQKPKLQKRSVSDPLVDVSVEKRVNLDTACLGDVANGFGETYFHKIRPEINSNFLERTAPPKLETISKKTDVPQSNSGCVLDGKASPLASSDNFTQFSPSPTRSLSSDTHASLTRGSCDAIDFEGSSSGSADLAGQTESMIRYIDDILMNENMEEEKSLLQQTGAIHAMANDLAGLIDSNSAVDETSNFESVEGYYSSDWTENEVLTAEETNEVENSSVFQAMSKEIAELISSEANTEDAREFRGNNDQSNTSSMFLPTEDNTTLRLLEGYTRMLSKHIADVSGTSNSDYVDYRSFITESDDLRIHFDDCLNYYLNNHKKNLLQNSVSDFKLLLRSPGEGSSPSSSRVVYSSMTDLLYRCAFAVSQGNTCDATDYLAELRRLSSPYGDYMQRMAHYFMEALAAKLSGTGEQLYTVITNNHPSAATMLKAYRQYVDRCPYIKLSHFFETKMTLDAFEGATRVHVVHYGIQYGAEWPCLIQHLSKRPEGPPYFRMTGVDVPYPGDDPCWKIHQTGRRLAEFAKMWNVPFEFQALAGKWESFTVRDFNLRSDEVLAVTTNKMHLILDESVLGSSPREVLLRRIRSLNPKVFFIIVDNAACNGPFFMTRFRESVKHYSAIFNGMELSFSDDDPERVVLEREIFGREVLNIVACEGQARVERQEPYRQWQNRLQRAGFKQVQPKEIIFSKMKAMMANFHKDYGVGIDDGWFLLGIKNEIVKANSCWQCKPVLCFMP